jgi:hypothetical protein
MDRSFLEHWNTRCSINKSPLRRSSFGCVRGIFCWDGDFPVDGEMAKAINEHTEMGLHTRAGDEMVGWWGLSEESEGWEGDGDLNVGCGLDEDDAISTSLFGGCWIWNLVLSHPCITFRLDPSTREPWLETA